VFRREFTMQTKREAYERSGGLCECHLIPGHVGCGAVLHPGFIFFEHIIQCDMGGDNSLENCAVLTKTCWKAKTAGIDLPLIAKGRRIRDREHGIRKRSRFRGWRTFAGRPVWNDQ